LTGSVDAAHSVSPPDGLAGESGETKPGGKSQPSSTRRIVARLSAPINRIPSSTSHSPANRPAVGALIVTDNDNKRIKEIRVFGGRKGKKQ
jgi:hypothetical protein